MEGLRQDTRLVVERLERQVARLRAGLWFMSLLVFGALGFMGWHHLHPKAAPVATALHVRGLVVEDERGTAEVVLDGTGLRLLDTQGHERGGLQMVEDGRTELALNDRQGAQAFRATSAEPGAFLVMINKQKDAVLLSTTQGPTLQMQRNGRMVVKQPYDAPEMK